MTKKITSAILFTFLVSSVFSQTFSKFTSGTQPFQILGNEHLIDVVQLGNGGKRALPKALTAQGLGLLDSIQYSFYGITLYNTVNGQQNALAVDAFAYPMSQDFPAKKVNYKQVLEGASGNEKLRIQFEVLFEDLPDTMVYQYIIDYQIPSIGMHYGNAPLRNRVDSVLVGISAVDAFGEVPFFYLLQGSPSEPEIYSDLIQPYAFLNNAPSENTLYTFSELDNGVVDQVSPRFDVHNWENGLRFNGHGKLQGARLYNMQGQMLTEANLVGDFLYFNQTNSLPTGIYPIRIQFKDGKEGVIKHWKR
ncbi:MAG TPA: hypothetical protein VFV37_09485 [Luteibaculaceae bacterium]|nr:hypothetical protein [Luteibaculaceae bacterium]